MMNLTLTLGAPLPLDLLERILRYLNPQDIITCTLISKLFNTLIRSSVVLQYRIACHAAGVVDNPRCKISYAERYQALLKREKAWNTFQPVFTHTLDVQYEQPFTYGLTAGAYLCGDSEQWDLHYSLLPSTPDEVPRWATIRGSGPNQNGTIVDVGMAIHEHDLIINVIKSPTENNTISLDMVLLQFSTGEYHPLARNPRIHVQELSDATLPDVVLEIVGDNVAIVVSRRGILHERLHIFDWQTGNRTLEHDIGGNPPSGLVFVSPEILLVPNIDKCQYEVWKIPKEGVPHQVLILRLPTPAPGYTLYHLYCYGIPNPCMYGQPYGPSRPFHTSGDDSVIISILHFASRGDYDPQLALVMHRRSLLKSISSFILIDPSDSQPSQVHSISWSKWGPPISRWFPGDPNEPMWHCGQRWVVLDKGRMKIIDFNPYNIHHVQDDLPGEVIIRRKGEYLNYDNVFAEDIEMGLDCIEYTVPGLYCFDSLLVEGERLLGIRKTEDGNHIKITGFYFG